MVLLQPLIITNYYNVLLVSVTKGALPNSVKRKACKMLEQVSAFIFCSNNATGQVQVGPMVLMRRMVVKYCMYMCMGG